MSSHIALTPLKACVFILMRKIRFQMNIIKNLINQQGLMMPGQLKDFPIRGTTITLNIKRRRWLVNYKNGKISRDWSIIQQESNVKRDFADFFKVLVHNNATSIKSLDPYYAVNIETFQKQYKEILSDFSSWNKKTHGISYHVTLRISVITEL